MRIVYVGPLWEGATCKQRMQALSTLGHELIPINTQPGRVREINRALLYRLVQRVTGQLDLAGANKQIINAVKSAAPPVDIVWIDKGLTIRPGTLKKIKQYSPKTALVHYNPDDPFGGMRSGWRVFLAGAPFYDIHFIPRPQNVAEYKALGCKNLHLFKRSYDPNVHHPASASDHDRQAFGGPVGFIGTYEKERAGDILHLAENGIPIRIWGQYWHKARFSHPNIKVENRGLWLGDYSRAICSFDINLSFLRKENRDFHNSRSIEIPACGGFMLAERSIDHLELFEEGKEAEYFADRTELLEKVKYYLANPAQRKTIAEAGHLRCLKSGHTTNDRMRELMDIVLEFKRRGSSV